METITDAELDALLATTGMPLVTPRVTPFIARKILKPTTAAYKTNEQNLPSASAAALKKRQPAKRKKQTEKAAPERKDAPVDPESARLPVPNQPKTMPLPEAPTLVELRPAEYIAYAINEVFSMSNDNAGKRFELAIRKRFAIDIVECELRKASRKDTVSLADVSAISLDALEKAGLKLD